MTGPREDEGLPASPGQAPPRPPYTVTVHCCFCPAVAEGSGPITAHARMEAHYREAHALLIEHLIGRHLK